MKDCFHLAHVQYEEPHLFLVSMDFPLTPIQTLDITTLWQQLCNKSHVFSMRSTDGKSGKQYFMSLSRLFILPNTQLFSLLVITHF